MDVPTLVPGKYLGRPLTRFRDKLYCVHNKKKDSITYRCRHHRRQCTGRMVLRGNRAFVTQPHTCQDDAATLEELATVDQVKVKAMQSPKPLRQIYNCQMGELAGKRSFISMESTLQRCRRKTLPCLPRNASEALRAVCPEEENNTSSPPERFTKFIQANVNVPAAGKAIVFFSNQVAEGLKIEQTEGPPSLIQIDGTFSVTPLQDASDGFTQLLCVLVEYRGTMLPAGFCLMTSKRQQLYVECLQCLKRGLGLRPSFVCTDFELGLMGAAENVFPQARLYGCHFHSSQAMFRRLGDLGLRGLFNRDTGFREWARSSFVLPLLPPGDIEPGIDELAERRKNGGGDDLTYSEKNRIRKYVEYLRQHWCRKVGVDRLSCFGLTTKGRTNNAIESGNRWMKQRLGRRPNFWFFCEQLS